MTNIQARKVCTTWQELDRLLQSVLDLLIADQPLPERCRDHAMTAEWKDHRDPSRPDFDLPEIRRHTPARSSQIS